MIDIEGTVGDQTKHTGGYRPLLLVLSLPRMALAARTLFIQQIKHGLAVDPSDLPQTIHVPPHLFPRATPELLASWTP
eukprot:3663513-Rhodomonas_salina.1